MELIAMGRLMHVQLYNKGQIFFQSVCQGHWQQTASSSCSTVCRVITLILVATQWHLVWISRMTGNIVPFFMSSMVILIFFFRGILSLCFTLFKIRFIRKDICLPRIFGVYVLDASTLSDVCFATIF